MDQDKRCFDGHSWRYGSGSAERGVPEIITMRIRTSGGMPVSHEYMGRVFFQMTEGDLLICDPANGGYACTGFERGLIRTLDISVAE